jgi:hypothetical protein
MSCAYARLQRCEVRATWSCGGLVEQCIAISLTGSALRDVYMPLLCVYASTLCIQWNLSNPDTLGTEEVSLLVRCNVHKQGVWDSQMCPVY